MRIIGGTLKGRRFYPPADNWPTRPTTDFAKEGLFNILQNHLDFEAIKVLDLFGGTGNHCFEFLSRGCNDVTYVDKFPACVRFVTKLSEELGLADKLHIIRGDVFKFLEMSTAQYDYIFAGPPYPLPNIPTIPDLIFQKNILKADGLFVLETNPQHDFSKHPNFWQLRTYSKTHFSFFDNMSQNNAV